MEILKQLKTILLSYPGERKVELLLTGGATEKRISLPMPVKVSPELEQEIATLLGS
jgi:hypothetical protein